MFQGEGSGQTAGPLQGTGKEVGRKAGDAVSWKPGKGNGEHGGAQGQELLLQGQEECSVPW